MPAHSVFAALPTGSRGSGRPPPAAPRGRAARHRPRRSGPGASQWRRPAGGHHRGRAQTGPGGQRCPLRSSQRPPHPVPLSRSPQCGVAPHVSPAASRLSHPLLLPVLRRVPHRAPWLAPIDRSGQPGASPGAALTSGAKVQPGGYAAAAGQPEPGPHSTMRLGLLCGLTAAAALMAVAGADHGNTKASQRREGTSGVGWRRPHRPCSGCFSVLSEESRSMSWRASEDDEDQPRRRARMEPVEEDGERGGTGGRTRNRHSVRHPRTVLLPRQEVLSAQTARQGAKLVPSHSPMPGGNRGPSQPQAMP
ncbi:uncharacterized protein AAGF69_006133 [Amazona ochrocephala]